MFVYTPKGFIVQVRAKEKRYFPGYFDLANGGSMRMGETDIQNAQREVHEELGIKIDEKDLQFVKTVRYDHELDNCFLNVYFAYHSSEGLKL